MAPKLARAFDDGVVAPFAVEERGLESVPVEERRTPLSAILWTWLAANIGIVSVAMGSGLVTSLGLNAWQTLLVAIVGSLGSFAFVALISLAGPLTGTPTLMASRATFGVRGNLAPSAISWIVLVGVEVVMATTATIAITDIMEMAGIQVEAWLAILIAILLVMGATAIGYFGHALIMLVQQWSAWVLGLGTVALCGVALTTVDWKTAMSVSPAGFGSVMAGIGMVAAGTGVGWMSTGADYSRYLSPEVSKKSLFATVVGGSSLPLVVMISSGTLLALGNSAAVGLALPDWLLVPYLIASVLGLLATADLVLYSSGLSLQAAGVPLSRPKTFLISAGVVLVLVIAVVAARAGGGEGTVAAAMAAMLAIFVPMLVAWVGVFGLDLILRRRLFDGDLSDTTADSEFWFNDGFHWPAIAAWLAGSVLGLLCIRVTVDDGKAVLFSGPLGDTWLGLNSLGWLVAGVWASAVYWVLEPLTRPHLPGRAHVEDE